LNGFKPGSSGRGDRAWLSLSIPLNGFRVEQGKVFYEVEYENLSIPLNGFLRAKDIEPARAVISFNSIERIPSS